MTSRHITPERRAVAVADYRATGDSMSTVAKRHGVSKAALSSWVNPKPHKKRGPKQWAEEEIALTAGRWVRDGLTWRWQHDHAA